MPKLIASSLSKDDFESMKVGGSMTVKPEGYATASIPVTVEWRNITLNAEVCSRDMSSCDSVAVSMYACK